MSGFPLPLGAVHFVGIGGIGMSGIAEVMHNLGHRVRGSDLAENSNVGRLRELGIDIKVGHHARNLGDASVVVVSSALPDDNPEVQAARSARIPVVGRAEMLAELMRFRPSVAIGGTHGKTTTTSLVAAVLHEAGLDPTFVNGGVINAHGTNARLGTGAWTVVEADESDGSIARLPATVAVVTNIDPEHLDHYGTFEALRNAFRDFVKQVPFYGVAVLCVDHPEVRRLAAAVTDRRIVTYGFAEHADVRATNVRADADGMQFDVLLRSEAFGNCGNGPGRIEGMSLSMPGRHSVQNALGAVAVGRTIGVAPDGIRNGIRNFGGVRRRYTRVGEARGVAVVDDYGHHPVEIRAVLSAARAITQGNVVAVVQPHRYSRLQSLFDDFCQAFDDASAVIVADVYSAGELPIENIDRDALVRGIRAHGHPCVHALPAPSALAAVLAPLVSAGDTVLCLGAGDITNWAAGLPGALDDALAGAGRPAS